MKPDEVIALLKQAKVEEALKALPTVEDKKEMAVKLTEFAGALNYVKDLPDLCELLLMKSLLLYYDWAPTHYNLGVVYTSFAKLLENEQLNIAKGEEAYMKALKIDPGYHEARYNLALLYYFTGRIDEARREYARITDAVGEDERFVQLGVLLENHDRLHGES